MHVGGLPIGPVHTHR